MTRFFVLGLLSLTLTACTRGPDATEVTQEIQNKLNTQFQQDLFKVISLKRQGSTPVSGTGGEDRVQVFFNTELELLKDHNLTAGQDLNLASLANLLGATEKGITGFNPKGNGAGDLLKVHGKATYALTDDGWQPVVSLARRSAKPAPDVDNTGHRNTAQPTTVSSLVKQLEVLVKERAGGRGRAAQVVQEELEGTLRTINFRLDRVENVSGLASGEPLGEYFRLGRALQDYVSGPDLQIRNYPSAGSVENSVLANDRSVDLAIIQNDVAALAHTGEGIFAGAEPMTNLQAVASLFPEQIQIVVLKSSSIETLSDLKGKRIDIGLPRSGSRLNALQVIYAHGLELSDFDAVRSNGFSDAQEQLKNDELDAFFVTLAAPSQQLHNLAATHPIRLLSLDPDAQERLLASRPYFSASTLPANTYPGQDAEANTLSVMAMLVAHKEVPPTRVEQLLNGLFNQTDKIARQSFQASAISPETARTGLSIPLHPGAEQYYGQQ
jgi:TRAP transporter TAXI family solute receptor